MKFFGKVFAAVLTAASLARDVVAVFIWDDYVNVKSQIDNGFPAYSAEDRIGVATAVQKMMKIYANRESKIKNYGFDPIPIFDEILENAANYTNVEFHTKLQSTYSALRDLHTNYYNPIPYQCYYTLWPLYFTPVHTSAQDIVANVSVRVSGLSIYSQVLNRFPGLSTKVSYGDELVTINGLGVAEFVETHARNSAGANDFGALRRVFEDYSLRAGYYKLLPNETTVEYVLKTRSGRHYTISGNITAVYRDTCVGTTSRSASAKADEDIITFPKPSNKKALQSVNSDFRELKAAFNITKGIVYTPYDNDILSYAIYEREVSTVGIIQLTSFVPSDGNTDRVVRDIRSLLTNEFKETNAVLFDIRDNGGGYISLADGIPQLFKNNIYPTGARAIVHPYNQEIYNALGGDWKKAYASVKDGDTYTPQVTFTSFDEANEYGVAYLKPVGLLTNGACFSACELFSANMQDWGAGVIIGEDGTTGGGGANVVEYLSYFNAYFSDIFNDLPSSALDAGQDMRLGWRQTVRNGKYIGQLIEDIGVESDVVVRPSVSDLTRDPTQNSWQLDRATEYLLNLGRDNHTIHLSFFTDIGLESFLPSASNLTLTGTASKLDSVTIFDSTGKSFGSAKLGYTTNPTNWTLFTSIPPATIPSVYTLTGYRSGSAVFSTKRTITNPSYKSFLTSAVGTSTLWDFTTNGFASISSATSSKGWNIFTQTDGKKAIRISDGNSYEDKTDASINFLVRIPEGSNGGQVTLSGYIDIEFGYDYLYGEISSTSGTSRFFGLTGTSDYTDYPLAFEGNAGDYVIISLRFLSDAGVTQSGITLTKISIDF